MKYRTRNAVVALLAAGVLVMAGLTTVAAHGPGGDPGKGGLPGSSAKPVPSGWAWPSDIVVKTHQPDPSKKPEPSKTPKPTPTPTPFTCSTTPTPTPTATATASAAAAAADKTQFKVPSFGAAWAKQVGAFRDHFNADQNKINAEKRTFYCDVLPLRKVLDAQITGRISTLQKWIKQVGKSGLGTSDVATVDSELNGLITDLQALKVQVDGETTLTALQADYQTLAGKASLYKTVQVWIQEIVSAEKLIAAGPGLVTLETKLTTEIAAAPASPETSDAQMFLDDMKLAVTAGEAVVAPLPAELLAITPAQLSDGTAKATLTSIRAELVAATWDIQLARMAGAWSQHEINEVMAAPVATPTPAASATATPV
jgi:hypothetical protein